MEHRQIILGFGKGQAPPDVSDVGLTIMLKVRCLFGRDFTMRTKLRMLGRGKFTGKMNQSKKSRG